MKTSILFRSTRWMMLAAALGTVANATPEYGPDGAADTADFIEMDVKADQKMIGCKVDVSIENGIATLSGTAVSLGQAERAASRAMATDNVRGVVNLLRIIEPVAKDATLADRTQQRLSKSPAIDASRIRVTVDGRKATLSGQVGSWDEQELARDIATEIPGLKQIDNRLEVTFDTVRTDKAIQAQIQHMVADDPLYAGITIDVLVKDGVVSLGGQVGSTGEKDQIIHRSHVTGVTEVWADDIMVNSDLAMEGLGGKIVKPEATLRALNDAFSADPRLQGSDIQATTSGNQITLTGTASSLDAKAAAESTARGLPGIMIISNEIRVIGSSGPTARNPNESGIASIRE